MGKGFQRLAAALAASLGLFAAITPTPRAPSRVGRKSAAPSANHTNPTTQAAALAKRARRLARNKRLAGYA